jgi:hypothetical protein
MKKECIHARHNGFGWVLILYFLFLFNQNLFEGAESLKLLNGKNYLYAVLFG